MQGNFIKYFATDRMPHDFPGIAYMIPLLLQAVDDGLLTEQQLVAKLYDNPRRIFGLPKQPDTKIEVW